MFIPEKRIGVVVLTNLNLSQAMVAASFVTMDFLLGNESTVEWTDYFQALEEKSAQAVQAAEREFDSGRDLSLAPRHDLQAYVGKFHNPGYGTFEIALRGDSLVQTYDGRTFDLVPYNGETFATRYQSTENHLHHMPMTFESNSDGEVIAVRIPIVPGIEPPRFLRE
ncbi:DUF3471 domain-containing protein [Microbulbifer agarilyticus]|uniref:DUF3471 domain-containing protein n=1 Tax=Microbulbifer agarilyticus TaxID=260552 RepID=UPI001C954D23|nr:DUF3471 domain-containing protein [Microbulbifer agarilyticus]MBY6192156.1 DUF3471 domain-containing protein [Microbulbifer agarilyticus]